MSCRKKCLKVKLVEITLAKTYILVLKEVASGKDQVFTFSFFYQPDLALREGIELLTSQYLLWYISRMDSRFRYTGKKRGAATEKQKNKQTKQKQKMVNR